MSDNSSWTQDLALCLLSYEAAADQSTDSQLAQAERVCERLRVPFSRFAGAAGFSSLLSRSIALAKQTAPSLGILKVRAGGALSRSTESEPAAAHGEKAGLALVTQLLVLLVTFIGETMTLAMLVDAWPDKSFARTPLRAEDDP